MSVQEIKEVVDLANNILIFIAITMAIAVFYLLIVQIRKDIKTDTSDIEDSEQ
ncbi:hypothetical protein KDK82_1029 [Delftia sp. K82]|uniref:hypothetical protein n=1 Tax=Delftia sp. K82 TaxID=1472718 RepID=UPI000B6E4543|nr:hypothetical protein [Delftia sp. K82]OWG17558.1 hypothetical protein KDK82_1029 [Delftia sp. K82]